MAPGLYESVARAVKAQLPRMHLHAFSPEEVSPTAHNGRNGRAGPSAAVIVTLGGSAVSGCQCMGLAYVAPDCSTRVARARR
jgi:hypothetical protein